VIIPCNPGETAAGGSAACQACPAGRECPDPTVFGGTQCAAGYYSVGNQTACAPCPRGYMCGGLGTAVPTACSGGTYASGTATSCTPVSGLRFSWCAKPKARLHCGCR